MIRAHVLQHDDGRLFIEYDTNPSTEMGEQEAFGETELEAQANLKALLSSNDPDSCEFLFGSGLFGPQLWSKEVIVSSILRPLKDRLAPTVESVPLGQYRHHKGTLYQVTGYTLHTETNEPLVSYVEANSPLTNFLSFSRPPHMFHEPVTWPDGTVGPRFKPASTDHDCPKAPPGNSRFLTRSVIGDNSNVMVRWSLGEVDQLREDTEAFFVDVKYCPWCGLHLPTDQ